ncbi:hypothetical protein B0H14DRAFT_3476167 [Mycena olivaceomarginata]|nr:hypothetical protein B0H14DRAFT_3476167 [Mycena olivaceomarginata]
MPLALELPFELISRIFIYCLPLRRRVRSHRNRAPLNLAGICTQWRAVAIAIPQLWASIYLDFCGRDAYNGIPMLFGQTAAASLEDHTAALIDLWFTRAPAYPLSISLICAHGHSLPEQVLTILAKHFRQWGRIELVIPMADFLVLNKVIGPFPSLESITIQITDGSVNPPSGIRVNSVRNSPHLRSLQVMDHGCAVASRKDFVDIPRTLTALKISRRMMPATITPVHFAALLGHFPHLVHLGGILARSLRVLPSHGITLKPSLETLLLDNESLLNYFAIPTLKHLGVWPTDMYSAPVVAFLSRSQCHLTSLSLGLYENTYTTTVVSCLSALPELRILRLLLTDETRQPGSFNGALWCQVLLRAALVPQLRTLLISGKARIPPYAEWAALLESRRATLVHAELHMWHRHPHVRRRTPPPPRRIEARLAALVEGGMTVRITTPGYTWPWDAEDVDHFDFDIDPFGSRIMRTQSFSPF